MHVSIVRRSLLAMLGSLIPAAVLPAAGQTVDALPVFRRGLCVAHAFGWADVEPDGSYSDPAYAASRFRFDPGQRRAIRSAGFDFVRLVVDVGPFLAFEGPKRARLDGLLAETVGALLDEGLGVIVDLHPSRMNPAYAPPELTAGVDTPKFKAVLALLTRMAAQLETISANRHPDGQPARLALELMNEPEDTSAAWQPMLEAAYHAARSGSARLPLVLGGGAMNAADALVAIDMRPFAGDVRLLYTFHDYEPWQFTHQGLRGNPAAVFDAVTYPAPETPDAMIEATERQISALPLDASARTATATAARRALASYSGSGFDRQRLNGPFARVAAWQKARGLPAHAVLLGEFGVHLTPYLRTPPGRAARECWLRDMREAAEAHGFAWAAWTYVETGGFALAENEVGPGFDASVVRALALRPS